MYTEIKQKATVEVKWAILSQGLAKIIQPLILLVMARFLSPSEYGIIEVIILINTLGILIQDLGLTKALIQSETKPSKTASIAFIINLLLSTTLYILIYFLSPYISIQLNNQQLTAIIRIASTQIIILGLGSVPTALAQRNLEYRKIFIAQLLGSAIMAIAAITLLFSGYGPWSFIFSSILGSLVTTVTIWIISKNNLGEIIFKNIVSLLRFGIFVTIESLQGWILNYGDNLFVGSFLGIKSLGTYGVAFNIAVFGLGLLITPVTSVAFSAFSRLKNNLDDIRLAYANLLRMVSFIVIPSCLTLVIIAEPLSRVLLKDSWPDLVPIIQILAISPGLTWLNGLNGEVYKAIGKPDIMPKLLFFVMLYSLPIYYVGTKFGIIGFSFARASVGLLFFPIHIFLLQKSLIVPRNFFWNCIKKPFLCSMIMLFVTIFVSQEIVPIMNVGINGVFHLLILILISLITYLLSSYWINKEVTVGLIGKIIQIFSNNFPMKNGEA